MTDFKWKIQTLQVVPQSGGFRNVVYRMIAVLEAEATDGVSASQTVNVTAGSYDPEQFIAFDDLTESIVITWLEAAMGDEKLAEVKELLEQRIIEQRHVSMQLPWLTQ